MGTTPNPMLVAVGSFVLVLALMLVPYWFFVLRDEVESLRLLRRRMKGSDPARRGGGFGVAKGVSRLSSFGPINALSRRASVFTAPLDKRVERSGLKVTANLLVLASIGLALVLGVGVWLQTGLAFAGWLVAAVACAIPWIVVEFFATQRLRKLEEQLPEAVDLIARSLRAGHALPAGLLMAAEELPEPMAGEFKLLHDHQNYGLPLPDALKEFASRMPLIDARFFVTAVLTQREAGGNLAEVLDNLSEVIRERFKVQRQLRVRAAHGRLTGIMLGILPPAVAVLTAFRAPEQIRLLFTDPLGIRLTIGAIALQLIGVVVIARITHVEY